MASHDGNAQIATGPGPTSWEGALPSLVSLGRARTRVASGYLVMTGASGLVGSAAIAYALVLFARAGHPASAGAAAPADASLFGCWLFAVGMLAVSGLMLQRAPREEPLATPVTEGRVLRLVEQRAEVFGTFAPDVVQIATIVEPWVDDSRSSFSAGGRRRLVLPASLLSQASAPLLRAAVDAALASVAGTSRFDVRLRSASELVHAIAETFRPASGALWWFWGLAFRLVEFSGFLVVWASRALAGGWLEGRARRHEEACAALARGIVPSLEDDLQQRAERFDAYLLSACRGVLAFGLLPSDPVEGFERFLTRAGSDREASESQADDLSAHLTAGYDAVEREKLRVLRWYKLGRRALGDALREQASLVARQLTKRRRDIGGAASTFGQLVRALEAGEADDIGRRLDPSLPTIRDAATRATRYNGVLFVALESLLATALLDRGARLLDPLRSGSIAVRERDDVIDVQAIVVAGLRDADGAAELRAWVERLRMPSEPRFYRETAETVADTPKAAQPFVAPPATSPGREALARANAARSRVVGAYTALLALTAVGAVPFGLLALQLGYRWLTTGGDPAGPHPYYPPLGATTLWYVPTLFVVIALLGLQSPELPRRLVDGKIGKRLVKHAGVAAARHGTRSADRFFLVADDPQRPQAELVDHVGSIFGGTQRRLYISDAVVDPAWEGDLEDALDRAFATVSGTGPLASALRARARCVSALAERAVRPTRPPTRRRRFVDWLARLLTLPVTWLYGSTLIEAERAAAEAAIVYGERRVDGPSGGR